MYLPLVLYFAFPAEEKLKELTGPGRREQWFSWKSKTAEQRQRGATMTELEKLLQGQSGDHRRKPHLSHDELTTVRKNLETQSVDVTNEFVSVFMYCVTLKLRPQIAGIQLIGL